MNNDRLYEPRAVPLGKECGCICPACRRPLYAKHCLDSPVIPHFQHEPGTDCRRGYETAIHLAAKQLIDDERRLYFPDLTAKLRVRDALGAFHDCQETVVTPGVRDLSHVVQEKVIGELRPDLFVVSDDLGCVLVEVAVTHFVGSEKLEKAVKQGLPLLELDLSDLRTASFEALRELIFNRGHNRQWLFHPGRNLAEQRLRESIQDTLEAARLRAAELAEEEIKRQQGIREEREKTRRDAEKLRQQKRTEERRAQRQSLQRATAFRRLPEDDKVAALRRWLGRDDLARLLGSNVRGGLSFGVKRPWIWQVSLFGGLLHRLETSDQTWITPNEAVEWLAHRFELTPEFPDSEQRAVWNYLDALCKRGAMVRAPGGRFRLAVASLNAYELALAVRRGQVAEGQLVWVDEEAWPTPEIASKVAEAHAKSGCPGSLLPSARTKSPLYIAEYYGGSAEDVAPVLHYLICAGFLRPTISRPIRQTP